MIYSDFANEDYKQNLVPILLGDITVRRTSSKDFIKGYDQIWQKGPEVKYKRTKEEMIEK